MYDSLAQYTITMQSGDNTAYNQIYNIMLPHVNALIKARGIDDHDVADIAQETMISVYRGIETIKDPQSTYKWVMTLTNNKITDFYRKSQNRIEHEVFITSEDDDLGEQEKIYQKSHDMQGGQLSLNVPEDIFVNREKQTMLLEIVRDLKEDEQQIIMMRCFSDTPFKEIAEALGCSESTVKTKFYRSLNKLESAIYETEKKEGIRLHSVGLIPFLLFLFMQYAKTVQVNPDAIEKVTEELSKEISRNASTSTVTAAQVGKSVAIGTIATHKVAAIVVGVVAVGMVGGTTLVIANSTKPDDSNYEMADYGDEDDSFETDDLYDADELESEQPSETEPAETEANDFDVNEKLGDYLQSNLIADQGQASSDFAINYVLENEDAPDLAEYSSLDGQGGIMGAKYLDIDGDSDDEMIVGVMNYEKEMAKINIQIYDYDKETDRISEITGGNILSAEYGNTNTTCQVAYQQKADGLYIYITDVYTLTLNEGGYGCGFALVWKVDDSGVTQLVKGPNGYDSIDYCAFDSMELAREQMPTIVEQWYAASPNGYQNDIFEKSMNDMNGTPLIKKISDMDSDYQELVYVGLMRKRNTTEWLCDIGNPVIYGYYDFYE